MLSVFKPVLCADLGWEFYELRFGQSAICRHFAFFAIS